MDLHGFEHAVYLAVVRFGLLEMLSGIFVLMKLNGQINWPWWVVLAPIWAPFLLTTIFFVTLYLGAFGLI